jgi:hypothetical protein
MPIHKFSHPRSQILDLNRILDLRGIAKGVALRLRRICSEDSDFHEKSKIYVQCLINGGHNSIHVNRVLEEVGVITRAEAHKCKPNSKGKQCVFVTKYNPLVCDIASIIRKYRDIIDADEQACEIFPKVLF